MSNDEPRNFSSSAGMTRRDALRHMIAGAGAAAGLLGIPSAISKDEWVQSRPHATLIIMGGAIDSVKNFRKVADTLGMPADKMDFADTSGPVQLPAAQIEQLVEAGDPAGFYRELRKQSGFQGKTVVVVSAASKDSAAANGHYDALLFRLMGANKVEVIASRKDAENPQIAKAIASKDTAAVFFDGGEQDILAERFVGTKSYSALLDRYLHDRRLTIAGSSAGAAVMAGQGNMIKGWNRQETEPELGSGLVLLPNIIVDTHLHRNENLPRLPRLVQAVHMRKDCMGIGLDEGTGVVIRNGIASIIGRQKVWQVTPDHPACAPGQPMTEEYLKDALPSFVAGQQFSLGKYATVYVPKAYMQNIELASPTTR